MLEELLARYGPRLRRTVARMRPAGASFDVDDVLQEVSLRLWKALAGEREIAHPASYLHRMAATAVIDALRRQRRRPERTAFGDHEEGRPPEPAEPGPSPELSAQRSRLLTATRRALERLPEKRRLAVRLYLQGFSAGEIADLVGWSEPKARNLLYRGLGALRGDLEARGWRYEEDGER